ncbi:MAG: HlyD family efflux transporter periplasmic adaptor subunit [Victivallaceae bacterium]|nr:HlyD family efflux transporter periplasmic adaptor subunit [Victivallaceae bacterium]
MKKLIVSMIVLAVGGLAVYFIVNWYSSRLYRNPAFVYGNGRIEATEINIAAKLAGKVEEIKVQEGDKVKAKQVLVVMQTNVLEAQLAQAKAKHQQAITAEASARAIIGVREASLNSAKAKLESSKAVLQNAEKEYNRFKKLLETDATSQKHFDTAEALWLTAQADFSAAQATVTEAEANVNAAKADADGAKANILAAKADVERIQADIDDSYLTAPLDGRIQYRVAEPHEVLSAGGRALNMVDLTDVYMTFFLSEEDTGKVRIGADARIVLDVAPDYPIPAKVTYVASVAQFTPKTVETKIERQKMMFRIKAHVNRELLARLIDYVKTGLPGVAWVRVDPNVPWPKELQTIREKGGELPAMLKDLASDETGKGAAK